MNLRKKELKQIKFQWTPNFETNFIAIFTPPLLYNRLNQKLRYSYVSN